MADARHTPEHDTSFRQSLVRNLGGAAGLVLLVAAIFGVLGMIGREDVDDSEVAADEQPGSQGSTTDPEGDQDADASGGTSDADGTGDPTAEPNGEPDDAAGGQPGSDGPDPDESDPDEPGQGGPDPEDAGEQETDEGAPEGEPAEDPPAADPPAADPIDPAQISVQVLDGFGRDGGEAAAAVARSLEDAGYDIVAQNPALAYDVTTVLWSEGFEAEGRQVAQEIGAAEARLQPGNLSSEVEVHVVVGADRG